MGYPDIDDYQILKYLLGESTKAEREKVFLWLSESDENRKTYFKLKALWFAYKHNSYSDKEILERSLPQCRTQTG